MSRYWVFHDRRLKGPLDPDGLRALEGFTLDMRVCPEGGPETDWRPAREHDELAALLRPVASAPHSGAGPQPLPAIPKLTPLSPGAAPPLQAAPPRDERVDALLARVEELERNLADLRGMLEELRRARAGSDRRVDELASAVASAFEQISALKQAPPPEPESEPQPLAAPEPSFAAPSSLEPPAVEPPPLEPPAVEPPPLEPPAVEPPAVEPPAVEPPPFSFAAPEAAQESELPPAPLFAPKPPMELALPEAPAVEPPAPEIKPEDQTMVIPPPFSELAHAEPGGSPELSTNLARAESAHDSETLPAPPAVEPPLDPQNAEPAPFSFAAPEVKPEDRTQIIRPEDRTQLIRPEDRTQLIRPEDQAHALQIPSAGQAPKPGAYRKLRILSADDDEVMRQAIAMTFKSEGHDVDSAEDGQAALDLVSMNAYDLVILDETMPKGSGFQVARAISQVPADSRPKVIIFTAQYIGNKLARETFLMSGADDVVSKDAGMTGLFKRACELTGLPLPS